ncbi:MAG: cobalamin B12-binding domain-containing protein [Phycisphaeraceae bacterium]|nr:cobalamin B12-binding domain-containing protein [Phycisphaeraceae bacterium]
MIKEHTLAKYLKHLLLGDRYACRRVIEEIMQSGVPANSVYLNVIWPIMVEIEKLSREDRITPTQEHLATRINRTIVDQLQNKLPKRENKEKKVTICCAQEELQELGAQMIADLFESDGWEVRFLGGGLSNDDIYAFINDYGPDLLVVYGSTPQKAPSVRLLIDTIKAVNAWPDMRIMVSGGLFARAEGLWEEIGADAFASTPSEALERACKNPEDYVAKRTINRRKRRKTPVAEVKSRKATEKAVASVSE